jgi:hypothetical protein
MDHRGGAYLPPYAARGCRSNGAWPWAEIHQHGAPRTLMGTSEIAAPKLASVIGKIWQWPSQDPELEVPTIFVKALYGTVWY